MGGEGHFGSNTVNVGANSDIDYRIETCVCDFLNAFAHVGPRFIISPEGLL